MVVVTQDAEDKLLVLFKERIEGAAIEASVAFPHAVRFVSLYG